MDPQVIIKNLTNRASKSANKVVLKPRRRKINNLLGKEEGKEKSYTHLHVLIIYIYILYLLINTTHVYTTTLERTQCKNSKTLNIGV